MSGVMMAIIGSSAGIGPVLETHTLTTGTSGAAPNRLRGFSSITPTFGTLSPTSTSLSGATLITYLAYDESGPAYYLSFNGGTNSGWTYMTIDSTVFTRASATYTAATFNWSWSTTDTIATQIFGGSGTTHTITFS